MGPRTSVSFLQNVICILIGIELNVLIALGSMDILMMLILPIHEHSICFHLFVSSLLLSSVFYSFLSTGLTPWLNLFLGTLFFLLL